MGLVMINAEFNLSWSTSVTQKRHCRLIKHINLKTQGEGKWGEMIRDQKCVRSIPEAPIQWDVLIEQHIVQAAFWAVFRYYCHVWKFSAATNKLAEVWMIKFPVKSKHMHSVKLLSLPNTRRLVRRKEKQCISIAPFTTSGLGNMLYRQQSIF